MSNLLEFMIIKIVLVVGKVVFHIQFFRKN